MDNEMTNEVVDQVELNDQPGTETPVDAEKTEKQHIQELKSARASIEEINKITTTVKSMLDQVCEQYGVTEKILDHLALMEEPDIDNMSPIDIQNFLKAHDNDPYAIESTYLKAIDKSESMLEFSRNALKGIREMYVNFLGMQEEKLGFIKDINDIQNNYEKYRSSEAFKQNREAQLNIIRDKISKVESEYLRKKLTKELEVLETAHECKFLLDRLKNGDSVKEIESVENQFFNNRLSSQLMDRFYSKAKKFNITKKLYNAFFSIEEKYLPEEYHAYNNFFLFYVTRYIVHCDINDKLDKNRVEAVIMNLIKLVQDRYATPEDKEVFLKIIRGFYIYVINDERTERFKEKNITYKGHPNRMKHHNELVESLKTELGPTYDESYDSYSDAEINETLFRMNQSDILMTKHIFRVTKNADWINNPHPYYEIKEEYDRIKAMEAEEETDVETESSEAEITETVEEIETAEEENTEGFSFNNSVE